MIQDLRPYPGMKDSGVPWLGEVPEHWSVRRLKSAFDRIVGGSTPSSAEATYWDGDIVWVTPADVSKSSRLKDSQRRITRSGLSACSAELVPSGSIIVTSRAPVGNVAIADVELCTNQGCKALVPASGIVNPTFGFRVLTILREELQSLATGTTFTEISTTRLGGVPVPLPPLGEQAAIVRFLDYVDRRIRRYIRAKQKLIKLLEEQKQVIIRRALTRGLDPNVHLKPSGVEWLGDVPAHWTVKRLKWVTRLQRGYDLPADKRTQGSIPVVSSGGTIDTHIEARAKGPGVVMGRYGSTTAVFFIETDFWPHNTALFVTNFYGNNERWCYYMLRTISKADHSAKSAVPGVDRKDLFDIKVVLPPVNEQVEIAAWLDESLVGLEQNLQKQKAAIELIRECRTRLIADVVTGKVDVREPAARLPEDTGDVEPLDEADSEVEGEDSAEQVEAVAEEAEA